MAFLFLIAFSLAQTTAASAEDPGRLIQSVIREQLEAFNADDYRTAYTYASKHIREQFSPADFETMVRSGYPQIARSRQHAFGEITFSEDRSRATVRVVVTGEDHVTIAAEYRVVLEASGWKIDGVAIRDRARPIGRAHLKP